MPHLCDRAQDFGIFGEQLTQVGQANEIFVIQASKRPISAMKLASLKRVRQSYWVAGKARKRRHSRGRKKPFEMMEDGCFKFGTVN